MLLSLSALLVCHSLGKHLNPDTLIDLRCIARADVEEQLLVRQTSPEIAPSRLSLYLTLSLA
jgi:hypothetical protein